jgi:hypothetical protein
MARSACRAVLWLTCLSGAARIAHAADAPLPDHAPHVPLWQQIQVALQGGVVGEVAQLLRLAVRQEENHMDSYLMWGMQHHASAMLPVLASAGANMSQPLLRAWATPLQFALHNGYEDAVAWLLSPWGGKVPVSADLVRNADAGCGLHLWRMVLDAGAGQHATAADYASAIIRVVTQHLLGYCAEVMASVHALGASNGFRPHPRVARRVHRRVLAIIRMLARVGPHGTVNTLVDGWTPLHRVAAGREPGAAELVELLLDEGADPTLRNTNGDLPVEVAHRYDVTAALLARGPRPRDEWLCDWHDGSSIAAVLRHALRAADEPALTRYRSLCCSNTTGLTPLMMVHHLPLRESAVSAWFEVGVAVSAHGARCDRKA